jgi:CRISPR-associated protein Cas6
MPSRPQLPTRPPEAVATCDGETRVPESHASIIDVAFDVVGTSLPADHDWPLLRALEGRLPWFASEALAGVHPLRTVHTSYGIALLALRAKLVLRLPAVRLPDALLLQDVGFDVGGSALRVGKGNLRTLRPSGTLSAHRVATDASDDATFEADVAQSLQRMGIDCGFISGRRRQGTAGGREIAGFALTLHGLGVVDSLRIQCEGLGGDRRLGWGIFVPAKAISGIRE